MCVIRLINFIENDTQNGHFQLDLGVAGGAVTGVSGTGNIVRLIFEHKGPRGQSVISISSLNPNEYNDLVELGCHPLDSE